MDTSRDYYEDRIADFNRYRRGRNLYQFCKDEGIDYNWMLRAQRQFGGKGKGKKQAQCEDTRIEDGQALIRLHFEDDMQPEAHVDSSTTEESMKPYDTTVPEHWKVSDVIITDLYGNEITLRCGSIRALGRILTTLADCHD